MIILWFALQAATAACPDPAEPEYLLVDETVPYDTSPPEGPEVTAVRFDVATSEGCERCDDALMLEIDLIPGADVDSFDDGVGVVARVVDGQLPEGVSLPDEPFLGPTARFIWHVPKDELLREIDVTVELRSMDRAGHLSHDALEVVITRDALPAILEGCNHTGRAAPWGLILLSLLWRRRRPTPLA